MGTAAVENTAVRPRCLHIHCCNNPTTNIFQRKAWWGEQTNRAKGAGLRTYINSDGTYICTCVRVCVCSLGMYALPLDGMRAHTPHHNREHVSLTLQAHGGPSGAPFGNADAIPPTLPTCEQHIAPVASCLWVLHVRHLHALEGGTTRQGLPVPWRWRWR